MSGPAKRGAVVKLPKADQSPVGLLWLLLACAVVLPLLLFAGVAWVGYQAAFAEARRDITRTSEVAQQQAERVFDDQTQVAEQIATLIGARDAPTIRHEELELHEAFARVVARLPQVKGVQLVGRAGALLVSAGAYPVPAVDLRDRDDFRAVIGGHVGTYVSDLQTSPLTHGLFFRLARPWTAPDGTVAGVIDIAVLPAVFDDFYGALVGNAGSGAGRVVTLIRDDGSILVRYPALPGPPRRAGPTSAFHAAIIANPLGGSYDGRSIVDRGAPTRLFVYRKVAGYPLYVVAGRDRSSIVAAWRRSMIGNLAFGVPATIALVILTWTALVRTRRETQALGLAQQEIGKRESAEAALLRAQRLEAVGQLTGGVAHDFNNLLTVIYSCAHMLMKRADNPASVRDLTQQILLAARRGGDVTQQLLAFSRRQFVKPETIDLNRHLVEFEPLLRRAARDGVRAGLDLAPDLFPVRLDPGHFEAAILNLVGNARDALPKHDGRIDISTRNLALPPSDGAELPPGLYVRVAVTDNGSGMAPEAVAKAFEPFFTTKEVGQGSGLGLSQVYGFAKQAGGDVRLRSVQGAGTTVEILLPRSAEPVARRAPPSPPAAPPLHRAETGEVVLIVEDEPAVLAVTVECLRDLGYATRTATSGAEALGILKDATQRIDVLFSDVVMPGGMSGAQLAGEARRLRPGLRLLLTSGYTADAIEGAPDIPVLTKPYNQRELASSLRGVLPVRA
jgi:two-component system NtrC family sensor kinase